MKIVIPTKGRPDVIGKKALRLFPDAMLCVGADEVEAFIHTGFGGSGGNARQRSSERHEQEMAYLKRKWGPYLDVVQAKGTTRLVVKVSR